MMRARIISKGSPLGRQKAVAPFNGLNRWVSCAKAAHLAGEAAL